MENELLIDRDKWLRGEGGWRSYLHRRTDGKMCCLGIHAVSCGIHPHTLIRKASLANLASYCSRDLLTNKFGGLLVFGSSVTNSNTAEYLMNINDAEIGTRVLDTELIMESEEYREKLIAEGFAKIGITVRYIN